ncbi:MAG: NAD(P)/FAD-dependent oxidoreductase [Bacteroidaceae bacterium]|nr:NAD(P)/FAD-dependent oxidoreductase [Bacteroidaceae bacterium]
MKTNTLIIGAGPAGSACAIKLMKAGIECLLIDKQSFPRQKLCAGLFTQKSQNCLKNLVGETAYEECMSQSSKNEEEYFNIFDKSHKLIVSCKPSKPITLVDREKFDQWLVNHFISLGGQFKDNTTITEIDFVQQIAKTADTEIQYEHLIAADGANSHIEHLLAREFPDTFSRKRKSSMCLEINTEKEDLDMKGVNIYLNIIPDSYAWVFSKKEKTCVGLVKLPDHDFDVNSAMRRFIQELKVQHVEKYPLRGAMLPIGAYMEKPYHWNTLFVGDAAGFVEPLTGEGIYYALQSGTYAAEAIIDKGDTNRLYLEKTKYLTQLIDKGQKYQNMLESASKRNFFCRHAGKHPNFISYFYDTQIENGCLDSFWKIVLKYLFCKK